MTVTQDFIDNMPLNGRSLDDLIALAPGASPAGDYGVFSINGQRSDGNNFTVDGVSANMAGYNAPDYGSPYNALSGSIPAFTALGTTQSIVPLDALQEFTIQTTGYTAENGRMPGGQVEFTTRSGTDSLHGSLFEYLRNNVFDANSWINNNSNPPLPKGVERQNDFGGTLGGPLKIPRLYNGRDKTFYFVSYEGLRLLIPTSGITSGVPSDAFRTWASPNVQPFLDAYPDTAKAPGYSPTVDGCTVPDPVTGAPDACDGTIPYSFSTKNDLDTMSFRVDHSFSTHWNLFVRYADTPSDTAYGTYIVAASTDGSHLWTAGLTGNLSRNIVSETRFSFNHESDASLGYMSAFEGSTPWSPSLTVASQFAADPFSKLQVLISPNGSNMFATSAYGGTGSSLRQYELIDSISWSLGNHALKFGVDWRHLLVEYAGDPYNSNLQITSLTDAQQGNATTLQVTVNPTSYPVFNNLSLYAQDHWKAGTRLTVDYGMRWELNPAPSVSQGYFPLAVNQVSNLATTQAMPFGTPLYHTLYTKFAPRLGFVYRMNNSSPHPIVVRVGGGLYYDTGQQMAAAAFTSGYPFTASAPLQNEVPLPLSQAALAPPTISLTPPYGPIAYFVNPNLTIPYTEQWNLSLDRTMNKRNVLTVSYVGNAGRQMLYWPRNPNAGNVNPLFSSGFNTISTNGASSSYNGLQVTDNGYIAKDLQIVGSYSYAHALDDASTDASQYSLQYGNSSFDLRHVLNLALNYNMPLEKGDLLKSISTGWLFAARLSAQTGTPIDIYQRKTVLPDGVYNEYRPNLVPGVPIYLHGSAAAGSPIGWRLNRAAFACTTSTNSNGTCSSVTPTQEGTLGRNYVRTPGFYNLNMSMARSFPVYEHLQLNFRADAFNILNHPNLADPETSSFATSEFGILQGIATTGTPNALYASGAARSLQLSLHLQF
jgi:hypothetical protein